MISENYLDYFSNPALCCRRIYRSTRQFERAAIEFNNVLKAKHTWVLRRLVGFLIAICNVPVQDTSYERGNQSNSSFGTGNRLREGEQQGHVAVNPVLRLQDPADTGGLRTAAGSLTC